MGGRFVRNVDHRQLVGSVRQRTGLDERAAERALVSVVRELAGCLTIGEAFNLAELLAPPLGRACREGAYAAGPCRFAPWGLVTAIAERERLTSEEAADLVAAVLAALREQLPEDRYGAVLDAASQRLRPRPGAAAASP
jgi:uncharacterized protein (DUF2267 family)